MEKNGYTLIELLVVILIMGVAVFLVISKTSYAFKDNTEELLEDDKTLILRQAKEYGQNSEELKEEKEMIIMVSDLVENEYLAGEDGVYYNAEGKDINDLKIKLVMDDDETVIVSFLD